MTRAACFHLHCYQPPRENPWLGVVEAEPSAWPHHDWNERITAECYRPNITAAVLDGDGRLIDSRDNLARVSFDVVPTLHGWLADHAPDVDAAVRAAARDADGAPTGAALASPAIHAILPLAHPDDRRTLVAWGVADFRARFGFPPQGMWLPEAAVDLDTLEVLVEHGIRFVVLMPQQARRARSRGGRWHDVSGERIDPRRPYVVRLPGGGRMDVVFGHGPLSRGVSFDGLLYDGGALASAVEAAYAPTAGDRLVAVVTDGETFGHHHPFGEMALAWALQTLEGGDTEVTTIGAWLRHHPPTWEVELVTPSSWSCAHGVDRWRADCGCATDGDPGWNQAWREPLRDALVWLRGALAGPADAELDALVGEPGELVQRYGEVLAGLVGPGAFVRDRAGLAARVVDEDDVTRALELLELRRHLLASTTSCAWFFADPARIEVVLALAHAAVALDIAERVLDLDATEHFLARLEPMRANTDPSLDGRRIWEQMVVPLAADAVDVAAWHAMEAVASDADAGPATLGAWRIEPDGLRREGDGVGGELVVVHRPTLRRTVVEVEAQRVGDVGAVARARDHGPDGWRTVTMERVRPQVVAGVAAARLVGDARADPLTALRQLTTELRSRSAEADDARAVQALAATVGPSEAARAAVRAALAVLRDAAEPSPTSSLLALLDGLAPLARAAGVVWPAVVEPEAGERH